MVRPGFLLITVVGCLLGIASASVCMASFDALKASAILVLAVMAHAAANVLNDYYDALNGADATNQQGLHPFTGGARLIQKGDVSVQQTGQLGVTLMAVVLLCGILLAVKSGGGLLLIGAVGLFLAWAYSAPPLALMTRGLGELTVAVTWGLIVIGADYSLRGEFFVIPAVLAVSYALLVANILIICACPDAVADAQVGKNTLAARWGLPTTAWIYAAVMALAYLWLILQVALVIAPPRGIWGLVALPFSVYANVLFFKNAQQPQQLKRAIVVTIFAAALHGLAMVVALASIYWW